MTFTVVADCGTEKDGFESRAEAQEGADTHEALCEDCAPDSAEIIQSDGQEPEVVEDSEPVDANTAEVVEPEQLSENPIGFLRSVNDEFVHQIQGTPAISKQGFRFIQREFGITTESTVVEIVDDPLGCVVWAKASLPDGHSAEAHGEGWKFESDVEDNEFVRYADTRAKNRALSDLTSAGALAVSELTGDR